MFPTLGSAPSVQLCTLVLLQKVVLFLFFAEEKENSNKSVKSLLIFYPASESAFSENEKKCVRFSVNAPEVVFCLFFYGNYRWQ